jgi:alpha-L-fucosidase
MEQKRISRRGFFRRGAGAGALAGMLGMGAGRSETQGAETDATEQRGSQRLGLDRLKAWEGLGYGMFIHYGMSTYVANELPDGKAPPSTYAPDKLDVDQWVSVARDAGMKYAVLTTKHVAGHCLWPSAKTDYTVANSTDKTDVVGKFVEACKNRGVLPGFYYCSWDNHNRFGSQTPSDKNLEFGPFTTSVYQTFQTAQITELLTQYGPVAEMWIDIPGVLGRGYRTYLYDYVAGLQPDTVIMMNSGISSGADYNVDYAWPSDLIAIERNLPPESGHKKWRTIEGKEYYLPGEICDPIGKEWFYVEGDHPRPDAELAKMYTSAKAGGVNLLLDVPPDKHGVIPEETVQALMRLRKNAGM